MSAFFNFNFRSNKLTLHVCKNGLEILQIDQTDNLGGVRPIFELLDIF